MSVFVVDASVAVKWMLPEPLASEAVRLQSPGHEPFRRAERRARRNGLSTAISL